MAIDGRIQRGYEQASFATWVGLVGNALLGVAKVVGGVLGTSEALVADGAESLSDSLASLAVVWGLSTARKPADVRHRYGHGKAEFIAAEAIGAMLVLMAAVIGYRGVTEILHPTEGAFPRLYTIWFVLATIVGKEGLYHYKIRIGRRLKSESLIADAWHHRSDAITSLPTLAAIGLTLILGPAWRVFDPIGAVITAFIILGMGIYTFSRTASALMDEAADDKTLAAIRQAAGTVPGVKDTEKLMTRRSGLETHMEVHVEVDPAMAVGDAHDIATKVGDAIRRDVPGVTHVTVHIEPYYPGDH
ncbi:MAG: cation transporter [Planctomycetes bacterium]|nr:cation transporter [Planctomycetota bacterium]